MDDVRLHLKIDDLTQDVEISGWIAAARGHVEVFTGRKLHAQTWRLKLDRFPCGPIWLPFPPVSSVTSITYVDTAGATQTWSSAEYLTDLPTGPTAAPARIVPVYGGVYPSTRAQINAVTVEFVCGYGAGSVPNELRHAMLLLIGTWDAERASVSAESMAVVPHAFESLCWPFKAFAPEVAA